MLKNFNISTIGEQIRIGWEKAISWGFPENFSKIPKYEKMPNFLMEIIL